MLINSVKYIYFFICIFLIIPVLPVDAASITQDSITNDCEKLAKDFQKEHSGNLIFIISLQENGAYETGKYAGHWINKAYSKEYGQFYYDPSTKTLFSNNTDDVKRYFETIWNKKVQVFNYNQDGLPFAISWHY